MTLIIAAKTKKDIIIASDTLATVKKDGNYLPNEIVEKIYRLNPSIALLIAGNIEKAKVAFIKDFVANNRLEGDVYDLHNLFLYKINELSLQLAAEENMQVCFAGFTKGKAVIRTVNWKYGHLPKTSDYSPYFIGGFESPSYRAQSLLVEKGVQDYPSKNKLSKIIRETIRQCIDEYKDNDSGERLGGRPDVRILSLK